MSHDAHEALPGYSPDQLLHAGCGECDMRAAAPDAGLGHLDLAEIRMLSVLWAVQVHLEMRGFPLGQVPENWMAHL